MTALASLHGPVALVLLCSLLFVEEAGVPLPFFPGDAILIVGGFLIGHGSLSPWIFIPLACLATFGGAMTAYLWARALGQRALEAVADRLHAGKALSRATARVQEDGPAGIAVCRLLPGLRVYTTMVARAVRVNRRDFVLGAVPAIVVWVVVFTLLGVLLGIPAEHLLTRVQHVAPDGFVLAALGAVAYLGIRLIPESERKLNPLRQTRRPFRIALGLVIDAALIATVASGLAEISENFPQVVDPDGLVAGSVMTAILVLGYIAATRLGAGGTAGEALLNVTYHPSSTRS